MSFNHKSLNKFISFSLLPKLERTNSKEDKDLLKTKKKKIRYKKNLNSKHRTMLSSEVYDFISQEINFV